MSENNFKSSNNSRIWQFNRQINVSTLLQLVLLAGLILGSWVNLQRQLDILQHDVTALLQCQKEFQQKMDLLSERSISYEYRVQALEKVLEKGREYE
jgi:flagellar biosynthesis chaperone FliJ